MKRKFLKFAILATGLIFTSCTDEAEGPKEGTDDDIRWITVSGALMDAEPGDGNAGTMVLSMKPEEAKSPALWLDAFANGQHVKSSRTARLQASADGKYLYNIQYTGDDGGNFNKYRVRGGKNYISEGPEVETATYVSTAPRWLKAAEGVGVAVRAAA